MNALCASYQQRQAAIFFERMNAFGYSRLREIENSGRRSESACSNYRRKNLQLLKFHIEPLENDRGRVSDNQ